jgi:N-methylhydantoinase B
VLRDVREEKISPARARDAYGVSVDTENWTVDLGETARLREKLKARGSQE